MKKMKKIIELPAISPIKKPRTKMKKTMILPPKSLRSIVDKRQKSLNNIMGSLCEAPKVMKAASDPKFSHPTTLKPSLARKAVTTNLDLRRSPRKHAQTAKSTMRLNKGQPQLSKNIEPAPKKADASPKSVLIEDDRELHSDIEGHEHERVKETATHKLVDEEDSSDESEVPAGGRFDAEFEQDKECNSNHANVLPFNQGHEENQVTHSNEYGESDQDEEHADEEGESVDDDEREEAENVELEDEDSDEGADVVDANTEVRKTRKPRGMTRCVNLVGQKGAARPTVILNSLNQPIGPVPIVKTLAHSVGILAKNPEVVSLAKKTWKEVSDIVKDDIWKQLDNNWIIPVEGKKWVLKTAADSWRGYKSRLKARYFNEHMSLDQLKKNRPKRVPRDQWSALIAYWLDTKTQERALQNQKSAAQRKNMHTAGSKSFARIISSEFNDGQEPSLAQVYIKTRTKSSGALAVDEKTREELKKIKDDDARIEEYLIANKLIKTRSGSVPLKGRGVTPSDLKRTKYENEVKKKAEDKILLVEEECNARIRMLEEKFTCAIQNVVTMFQSTNHNVDLSTFNPFQGCDEDETARRVPQSSGATNIISSPDNSYVPDESDGADDDNLDFELVDESPLLGDENDQAL